MQTFLKHAPRWVALLSYTVLALVLAYVGAYATLYRVSDVHTLNQRAATVLQGTGYSVSFDADIGRHLFPRPTIVLRNVQLRANQQNAPDLTVAEMKIGIAWQSLWGDAVVEKLVLDQAQGKLYRTNQGKWNVSALMQAKQGDAPLPSFNRILVERSQLGVHYYNQDWTLQDISLQLMPDGDTHRYHLNANIPALFWDAFNVQAAGKLQITPDGLLLPDLAAQFSGKERGYDFAGTLHSAVQVQQEKLLAKQNRIMLDSKHYQTHINTTIEQLLHQQNGEWESKNGAMVLSANPDEWRYQATLKWAQLDWSEQRARSQELNLNLNASSLQQEPITLTAYSDMDWNRASGWSFPKFKLMTLQENPSKPRFVSEWEGSLHIQSPKHWQAQAQGLFDRQPASWVLQRNDANVQGSVNLAKLQLRQYLNPDKEWQLGDWRYPDWLQDNISLNVQVNLDDLELDGASVNNIRSTVQADAERVAIDPMSADVYNGKSAGSLHILNRQPMEWELNQSAQNIEVQPLLQDLFQYSRFSGKGNVDLSLRGQGLHYRDWLPNFSGSLQLDIQDGEWQGINFSQLAKKISGEPQLLANNETPKTPFSHFQLHTKIEQGVSKHQSQATLLRPAATVQGQGEYHFQQNQLDEDLLIVGEGSQTPLPLHIRGKLDEPEISLNYQQMTSGLKTPQEKQQAVSDTLKKQWQWLLQSNQKNKE